MSFDHGTALLSEMSTSTKSTDRSITHIELRLAQLQYYILLRESVLCCRLYILDTYYNP